MRNKSILVAVLAIFLIVGLAIGGDKYEIDRVHSYVGFSAKHFLITNVKGKFKDFSGEIMFDANDISKSAVNITIKVASLDTDNERRDNHLRSGDFFEAEKYPEITFQSKRVSKSGDGYVMVGDLTLRGVTKEVSFPFNLAGPIDTRRGKRLGIEASLKIMRTDFGVAWDSKMADGNLVVSNEIKIELEVEAREPREGTN